MKPADKKRLEENPVEYVESLEVKHTEELKAKDDLVTKTAKEFDDLTSESEAKHTEALKAKDDLAAEVKSTTDKECKTLVDFHDEEIVALKEEILSLKVDVKEITKEVIGTAKVGGKVYAFKPGFVSTRNPLDDGKIISSEDALEDKKLMAHLVEIGYGGIHQVKK